MWQTAQRVTRNSAVEIRVQAWILEADIYRLRKALHSAPPEGKDKLKAHLRRVETKLGVIALKG